MPEERKKISDPEFHKALAITNAKFEAQMAATKAQIDDLNNKIAAQNQERLKSRLFGGIGGLLSTDDDDIIVPDFLKKEDKKRA